MNMTEHFLADYHHWGDPTIEIEKHLTIPVRRVKRILEWDPEGPPPFIVFGCTWHHRNSQGPLTQEKFEADLSGAIVDFANEVNHYEEFLAYPITHKPPVVQGIAYHDWIGPVYPFDIRATIILDEAIPVQGEEDTIETGLTFNLLTLLAAEVKQRGD
jgi:hypothetical protein